MSIPESRASSDSTAASARADFEAFVAGEGFSCVAARSALQRETMRFVCVESFTDPRYTPMLHRRIAEFARERDDVDAHLATLVVIFGGPLGMDEAAFEEMLWSQLQLLADVDSDQYPYAKGYSPDPRSDQFAMSVAGEPFFVVGLHPAASRLSRRFRLPVLVFNSHVQFERLKERGVYQMIQRSVRRAEMALQGSLNPALAEFGETPEAVQYASNSCPLELRVPLRSVAHVLPGAD